MNQPKQSSLKSDIDSWIMDNLPELCYAVCAACGHDTYSHYWSGGGDARYAGWDSCGQSGCDCVGLYNEAGELEHEVFVQEGSRQLILDKIENIGIEAKPEKGALSGRGLYGYNKRKNKSVGHQIVGAWDDALDEYEAKLKQIIGGSET